MTVSSSWRRSSLHLFSMATIGPISGWNQNQPSPSASRPLPPALCVCHPSSLASFLSSLSLLPRVCPPYTAKCGWAKESSKKIKGYLDRKYNKADILAWEPQGRGMEKPPGSLFINPHVSQKASFSLYSLWCVFVFIFQSFLSFSLSVISSVSVFPSSNRASFLPSLLPSAAVSSLPLLSACVPTPLLSLLWLLMLSCDAWSHTGAEWKSG